MSWVHLNGERWEATQDIAELQLHLARPTALGERQDWSLELTHMVPRSEPAPGAWAEKFLTLHLEGLGWTLRDWRQIAGRELRADAAWHGAQPCCHSSGLARETTLEVWEVHLRDPAKDGPGPETIRDRSWRAHDFTIRFGARGGFDFPMELEAWLLPEETYWQREPEPAEALRRFGEGAPNLRVMAPAVFTTGWVHLPPGRDPLASARRILREEVMLEEMHEARIQWATRPGTVTEAGEVMRQWPPTVFFQTEPGTPRRRRSAQKPPR
ncbi:MAG TPA: hypothetical protein VGO11_13110 [Chthoniobacteraceae bacterium]|jgi:hypothetical protein|nr:hypothetical protein [Chthoniobacteraceae bacterium]